MRTKQLLVAVLAALPIGLVAMRGVALEVRDLLDPCLQWGESNSGSSMIPPPGAQPGNPCSTRVSGTSETRQGSIIRTALVPGGILAAIALGVFGAARSQQRVAGIGAVLMLVEAVPLIFSVAPLAVLTGGVFLWVATRQQPAGAAA